MPTNHEMGPSRPVRATRLIFEYEGDQVRLVHEMPVEVASVNVHAASHAEAGVFVDVRDAANRTLARVPTRHALSSSTEVFPERHDEPITRTDMLRPKGAFTVIVPTSDDAHHATIVNVPVHGVEALAEGIAGAPRAVDLFSFPLKTAR